ncbi:MAG TPA: hypothetical protein PLB78_17415, partial [Anaerolineae bacterium]|nr:hypothetical protein [Anaerolineae bacterium]
MAMTATPQWIARMYPPSTGRDHLGVTGVSSDQILPSLVPGINVLTYHPRYHSFYVFLLDEFWKRDRLRTPTEWTKFFRPREFIFSLAANLCDRPEHGDMRSIVGGQKTGPLAAQRQEAYDTSFDYIKSDLGGYGLYYRSVMAELGLIYPGGPGLPYPVDLPTEGRGKRAAAAFREAVQQTEYLGSFFDVDSTLVPFDVIQEYGRKACLCQSQLPDAPDRDELRDAYLHGGTQARPRRETLRLFLDMASQTEGHEVSQDSFRQLIYYGAAPGGAHYHPRPEVALTHRRWRLYQTREYYAFALNALWCHFCDWGLDQGGDVRPTPLADFWEHVEQALDFDALASRLNLAPPAISAGSRFKQLLEWLTRVVGADHASFDAACGLGVPLNEHRLYRLANEHPDAPEVMVAGMIAMLALILLHFGQRELWLREEWS